MVDFALDRERDTLLSGEVQHFCQAHERVADLAKDLAKLKKLYWNTQWEEYNFLHMLAQANAFQCLKPHILHDVPISSNIPHAMFNAGVNDFTNRWKHGPKYDNVVCEWCVQQGHPTEKCSQINQCVLCYRVGHIELHCHFPHKHC